MGRISKTKAGEAGVQRKIRTRLDLLCLKKNQNAPRPSEHPPVSCCRVQSQYVVRLDSCQDAADSLLVCAKNGYRRIYIYIFYKSKRI